MIKLNVLKKFKIVKLTTFQERPLFVLFVTIITLWKIMSVMFSVKGIVGSIQKVIILKAVYCFKTPSKLLKSINVLCPFHISNVQSTMESTPVLSVTKIIIILEDFVVRLENILILLSQTQKTLIALKTPLTVVKFILLMELISFVINAQKNTI